MTDWERPIVTKYLNQAALAGILFFAAGIVAQTTMAAASAVPISPLSLDMESSISALNFKQYYLRKLRASFQAGTWQ